MKRPSAFFYFLLLALLISSGIFPSFLLCIAASTIFSVIVRLACQLFLRWPIPKNTGAVLITGCSSGFGEAMALRLAKLGLFVFAGVRSDLEGEYLIQQADPKHQDFIFPVILDVTKPDQIAKAVITIQNKLRTENRKLTYLINNAGISEMGTFESVGIDKVQALFDVNFFGVVRVTQAFLPLLKENSDQSRCRIINMGSMCGLQSCPFFGTYSASKHALEAITEQMRMELSIPAIIVEPGTHRTQLTQTILADMQEAAHTTDQKKQHSSKVKKFCKFASSVSPNLMPGPKPVLDTIEYLLFARFPPVRALVGWDATFFLSFSWLPDSVLLGIFKFLLF